MTAAVVKLNTQYAKWPDALQEIVDHLEFRGLRIKLWEHYDRDYEPDDTWPPQRPAIGGGTTLEVVLRGVEDTYHPGEQRPPTRFLWPVPPATFNRESWLLWLLDRLHELSFHEDMEHFKIVHDDGTIERPFAPLHGPGDDPNRRHIWMPDLLERRRTSFTGEVKAEDA